MWFLGAGASASAGIPTAGQMIWDFKQRLFVSQRKVSPQTVADLSNPSVRDQIQSHIDSSGDLPVLYAPDEYAGLFEAVYPAESDRRAYLDSKLSGAKPSFGHFALATLMHAQQTKIVWTTNFDSLVADAAAKVYDSTGPLSTVDLDAPELAAQLIGDGRWPIEIKIHGDFRSRRLKNTDDELRLQDAKLRKVLVDSCRRFGLVVAGYSGRDGSVMEALREALDEPQAYPSGLFWLHRGEEPPFPEVSRLLCDAAAKGVEAALVPTENFDETLRDLVRLAEGIDTSVLDGFASERQRLSPAPHPTGRTGWPVVRLNAIPVVQYPTVCRIAECSVGGFAEAREAIEAANVNVLVSRIQAGVICYGSDADVRAAFDPHNITEFDLHPIQEHKLRYDSGVRSLLRDAMTAALARRCGFDIYRRRNLDLLAPKSPQSQELAPLKKLVGQMSGVVKEHNELRWREGVGVRLDWANDQLWLLLEPCTVFEPFEDEMKAVVADFSRERTVKRYNRQLNDLLDFWAAYLAGSGEEFHALGVSNGVDAPFKLSTVTAFSRRLSP